MRARQRRRASERRCGRRWRDFATHTTHTANEHLYKRLACDPVKDFAPVTGVKGYAMGYSFATYVPAGTPPAMVARLNELPVAGTRSAIANAFFDGVGAEAWSATPDELAKFQAGETQKWSRVIKAAGIDPE